MHGGGVPVHMSDLKQSQYKGASTSALGAMSSRTVGTAGEVARTSSEPIALGISPLIFFSVYFRRGTARLLLLLRRVSMVSFFVSFSLPEAKEFSQKWRWGRLPR